MKNCLFVLFVSLTLLFIHCTSGEKTSAETTSMESPTPPDMLAAELNIDVKNLIDKQQIPENQEVIISYDPFFKKSKKFLGFSLQHLLDSIISIQQFDTTNAVVVFECSDGYTATMPLALVLNDKNGFIATRDLEAPPGKNWLDSLENKMRPAYLVWQNIAPDDHNYTWPYGISRIRIIPAGVVFKEVYPFDAPEHVAGFELFSQNCMKCHSVNKVGGTMAPEFNIPKNITEYWSDENIISFAKNPQAFRYSSIMPPVTNLSEEAFNKILDYLKYIAKHKINI